MTTFADFPTGNLCNADARVRCLPSGIRPLLAGRRIFGPALTVRITPGQNGAIHRAVHSARRGNLLVVDGGGSDRFGPFGDLLADACIAKGLVGAVFNCTVRDKADIAALDFQVFARGFHPEATEKSLRDEVGITLDIEGTPIAPGDIVVADDDGVVVVPVQAVDDVLASVKRIAEREDEIRARIRAGETTCDIFNIDP